MNADTTIEPQVLVLFGARGDRALFTRSDWVDRRAGGKLTKDALRETRQKGHH
ncbi:Uncharacterised protein [Mycolicibacterium vanbaalenii]|uniref:Uncharacterized protein n=1 Tax=Mycolicibacterium vanbaalenii TaxID=110539 RepID=A0A5S9PU78_MYCVN|nr:hypothetical protein [Mycolicibacterium vanbaalenii]CAA0108132.1 Uncharacterised protein [Mycolicibacterium vanbaalenii]